MRFPLSRFDRSLFETSREAFSDAVRQHRATRCESRNALVALGGGGARGLAHLGAMEAIGEAGVITERIVGVSMGSLIGGLCAAEKDIHRVQATAIELLSSPVFSEHCQGLVGMAKRVSQSERTHDTGTAQWLKRWYSRVEQVMKHGHHIGKILRGPSILSNSILREAIDTLLPDIDLSELAIPLSVVAVDLKSGQTVVLEQGSLRKAVLASTAIPGFFEPVPWGDMLLCDIGVLDSLPISIANSYRAAEVIAVDVSGSIKRAESFGNALEVMLRMEEIGERLCRRSREEFADIVIRPDVSEVPWYDFTKPAELILAGRIAGRNAMNASERLAARMAQRISKTAQIH